MKLLLFAIIMLTVIAVSISICAYVQISITCKDSSQHFKAVHNKTTPDYIEYYSLPIPGMRPIVDGTLVEKGLSKKSDPQSYTDFRKYETTYEEPIFSGAFIRKVFKTSSKEKNKIKLYYHYIIDNHTAQAVIRTGHKKVVYWKRIRSWCYKKRQHISLPMLIFIILLIIK